MGHCLNLYHTHRGGIYEQSGCVELANGSNCSTCGDMICYTPADPGILNMVNSNCQYTGPNQYQPDIINYMSYSGCRNHFTSGQVDRMHLAIIGSSLLQQVVSSECNVIVGKNEVCKGTFVFIFNFCSNVFNN